jgi:hypothetical protein
LQASIKKVRRFRGKLIRPGPVAILQPTNQNGPDGDTLEIATNRGTLWPPRMHGFVPVSEFPPASLLRGSLPRFGAPGTDLVALGPDLAAMCPEQAEDVLYIFPQAPLDLASMGLEGARAWWMIDIERFQRSLDQPEKMARFRRAIPEGMPESSNLLR